MAPNNNELRQLRVLAVSKNFPNTVKPYEGSWAYTQFKSLEICGAEVKVFAPHILSLAGHMRPEDRTYRKVRPTHWHEDGMEVFGPKYTYWLAGRALYHTFGLQLYHAAKKDVDTIYRQWPFDVLYGQGILPDSEACVLLARRYGIVSAGCIIGEAEVVSGKYSEKYFSRTLNIINELDVAVAESRAVGQAAEKHIGHRRTVHTLHRGTFPDKLRILPEVVDKWRAALGLPDHAKVAIYVGHLYEAKGVLDLLEAFRRIADEVPYAHVLYVGGGDLEEKLISQARQWGLESRVHVIGAVPFSHVQSLRSLADFQVSPSHSEGLGVVNIEAGLANLPVLGARVGGIPEAIIDGQTGILFEPKNIDELASGLKQLYLDANLCRQMGAQANKFVREYHDAKKNTKLLYDLLIEAVNNKQR